MKTLILYATKHGAAGEVAQRIAKEMDGAALHDLKKDGGPAIDPYDCIIIGSSLYAGMIRKEAKEYIRNNMEALTAKKLGLYLCGMDGSKEKEYFHSNFAPEILKVVKAASFLGGIYDPKKSGMFERIMMKAAAKLTAYTDSIDEEKIKKFAGDMKR